MRERMDAIAWNRGAEAIEMLKHRFVPANSFIELRKFGGQTSDRGSTTDDGDEHQ